MHLIAMSQNRGFSLYNFLISEVLHSCTTESMADMASESSAILAAPGKGYV